MSFGVTVPINNVTRNRHFQTLSKSCDVATNELSLRNDPWSLCTAPGPSELPRPPRPRGHRHYGPSPRAETVNHLHRNALNDDTQPQEGPTLVRRLTDRGCVHLCVRMCPCTHVCVRGRVRTTMHEGVCIRVHTWERPQHGPTTITDGRTTLTLVN